jgi:hypothetical protein
MKVIRSCVLLLPLGLVGCGKTGFTSKNGEAEPGGETTQSADAGIRVEDRQSAVAQESSVDGLAICAEGNYEVQTQRLNFNQRQECRFGQGGNLGRLSGFMQAREKQAITLTLPENTVLCGFDLASPAQDLHYDDYLFLNLNQRVLVASETGWADLLTVEGQRFKNWDWSKLKGQDHAPVETDALYGTPYCHGDEDCQVPMHDATGGFQYQLDFAAVDKALYEEISESREMNFSVVATGDNNDGDCDHSTFQLDLALKLYHYKK